MITRTTLYSIRGGDTVQVSETAKHLSALGVEVDIRLTNECIDYEKYDLLHFFNITRPADILFHIKKSGKPYAVSTILVDYSDYDKFHRKGIAGLLFRFFSADAIEYIKTVGRWLRGRDRLMTVSYLWKGQRNSIRYILAKAAILLPNSKSEYERLVKRYGCNADHIVVPNGIDETIFHFDSSVVKDDLLVICAARIEGIKNQLNLIKALNGTKYQLLLIGAPAPNQPGYYADCRKQAGTNIHFINQVSQQELLEYYRLAKIHILPSWFETTGLSSLEAAAMGCQIVISKQGDAKEYFGNDAFYCDPASCKEIYAAVDKAANASCHDALREKILNRFTWKHAALNTLDAYQKIILTA